MNLLFRFLFVLAYFSFQLASADQSTRERIAMQKKWLEQRQARKKQLMQAKLASNLTDEQWWAEYYRYYRHDLNKTSPTGTKTQRRPVKLNFQLKSKRKKQQRLRQEQQRQQQQNQQIQTNSVLPHESFDISISTTIPTTISTTAAAATTTTTPLPITPFVAVNPTTAGITKSSDELQSNIRGDRTTSEIDSSTRINDRMSLNESLTERFNEISTTMMTTTPTPATTEHSITYNVTVDKLNRAQNALKPKSRKLSNAIWGRWQKWTKCSRSCGGGVMSQSRPCLSRDATLKNRTSNECIGLQKRYRICNEQSCPESELDFRDQQCIFYNNQSFHGKTYSWESYVVDEAECELNCAMCVDGICKAIHNSGIQTGAFMNNGAVRCGSTVCNQVSKTFTENPLPIGYYSVATIPAGASNISILELKNSENYLVLKRDHSFIINGDNIISDSGVYNAAGAIFDYRRIDDAIETDDESTEGVTEWITATGPIREAIHLMVLSQSKNPGIKYEYLMPVNPPTFLSSAENCWSVEMEADMPPDSESSNKQTESEKTSVEKQKKKKHSYVWKVVSFSSCSKTCGGGTLTPIIRCVREGTSKFFNHKRCVHQTKPVLNENVLRCNSQPCPAYWKVEEWSACNCGLPNEHEHQTGNIKCVQELSAGVIIQVHEGACLEKQPDKRQDCDCPKQQVTYHRNSHRGKDKSHHHHHPPAPITLIGNSTIGKRAHHLEGRKPGAWLASDWTEQCSTKCGEGTQYRSIFCDRSVPKSDRCDVRLTPDTTTSCTETARCNVGDWFIGPWGECFGDCFNLMRSRSVLCIKDDQIVGDSLCSEPNNVETTKPLTMEKCELKDVSYCKPKWHYSEWSECTRSCGKRTQRRIVKCLEPDLKETLLKESDSCRYSERPKGFRSCNEHDCTENESSEESTEKAPKVVSVPTKKISEPKVRLIQNDSTPKKAQCEDRFPNCLVVVRARLCTYDYYIENCCAACQQAIALGY